MNSGSWLSSLFRAADDLDERGFGRQLAEDRSILSLGTPLPSSGGRIL